MKRNSSYFQTFYFCGPSPAWTEYVKLNETKVLLVIVVAVQAAECECEL